MIKIGQTLTKDPHKVWQTLKNFDDPLFDSEPVLTYLFSFNNPYAKDILLIIDSSLVFLRHTGTNYQGKDSVFLDKICIS